MRRPASSSERAGHVLAAAHRRFHFAVAVGALGDVHFGAVGLFDRVVLELLAALAASHRADAHSALLTGVKGHIFLCWFAAPTNSTIAGGSCCQSGATHAAFAAQPRLDENAGE